MHFSDFHAFSLDGNGFCSPSGWDNRTTCIYYIIKLILFTHTLKGASELLKSCWVVKWRFSKERLLPHKRPVLCLRALKSLTFGLQKNVQAVYLNARQLNWRWIFLILIYGEWTINVECATEWVWWRTRISEIYMPQDKNRNIASELRHFHFSSRTIMSRKITT